MSESGRTKIVDLSNNDWWDNVGLAWKTNADATPEAVKAIQRGSALKADVAQQPKDLGAKTIDAIATHFKGGQAQKSIAVPVRIVDANTLKEPSGTPIQ